MHPRFFRSVAAVLVALAAAACGGIANPSSNQTQTFSSIVTPGGAPGKHEFTDVHQARPGPLHGAEAEEDVAEGRVALISDAL